MNPASGPSDQPLRRFDFESEVVSADDATSTVIMRWLPDPRRYSAVQREGKTWFLDKYLNELVDLSQFVEAERPEDGRIPIYHLPSSVKSTEAYSAARGSAVRHELATGEFSAPAEAALPHRAPAPRSGNWVLAFVSVDICGATALRRAHAERFERAYDLFMKELGALVGHFGGSIVKTKGDGFIACIDHPSFTSQCDNIIDLGRSLILFLKEGLNPALVEQGLPALSVRVGTDFGKAAIRNVHVPATGFATPEIASDALNRAVKIEESCDVGEFRIGRGLYELIHVQWLERAQEVPFDGPSIGVQNYQAYRIF